MLLVHMGCYIDVEVFWIIACAIRRTIVALPPKRDAAEYYNDGEERYDLYLRTSATSLPITDGKETTTPPIVIEWTDHVNHVAVLAPEQPQGRETHWLANTELPIAYPPASEEDCRLRGFKITPLGNAPERVQEQVLILWLMLGEQRLGDEEALSDLPELFRERINHPGFNRVRERVMDEKKEFFPNMRLDYKYNV